MAHKVSMQQIADRLGVSKYTVSQALSGKEGVSEATRKEVIAMARALGYRVRKDAETEESLQTHAGNKIDIVSPLVWVGLDERHGHEPNFWQRVRQGIEAGSSEHGLSPHFFTFGRDKSSLAALEQQLMSEALREVTGFIIVGRCPIELLLLLNRMGLPIILVDHQESVIQADAVLNANIEAGRMACHHLLSQGCRSIVFVGRDSFAVSFRERFWGCRLALEELQTTKSSMYSLQLAANSLQSAAWLLAGVHLKKWTVPYGSRSWRQSLERRISTATESNEEGSALFKAEYDGLPDGFVCANDEIALALMQSLQSRGIEIPTRCRVVGIDNTAASREAAVPLTTVDLAKEWLGIRAVESFVRRRLRPEAQHENITLSARLIIRESG
ncbi:LacI family transcriptional regulator [Paenibacillus baekrokdamisoli]|uniref:LacI family transcriptional regulator n=1 Tax=Paenibacillus baekrokdamisoli TaxID=1712516 RepID=A0A3G9IR50_9BACL|nr:LacI family DNA-binding transcriptional regulator [Paenibacillus baekrokdamisoli]MBB3070352.1 LacI family transcriptional regulator [Paenibacillus baekrokdamisoli]BBH21357.1 LacI family transcriptional regulator [Paenibacillus baekrokdamisoli]